MPKWQVHFINWRPSDSWARIRNWKRKGCSRDGKWPFWMDDPLGWRTKTMPAPAFEGPHRLWSQVHMCILPLRQMVTFKGVQASFPLGVTSVPQSRACPAYVETCPFSSPWTSCTQSQRLFKKLLKCEQKVLDESQTFLEFSVRFISPSLLAIAAFQNPSLHFSLSHYLVNILLSSWLVLSTGSQ